MDGLELKLDTFFLNFRGRSSVDRGHSRFGIELIQMDHVSGSKRHKTMWTAPAKVSLRTRTATGQFLVVRLWSSLKFFELGLPTENLKSRTRHFERFGSRWQVPTKWANSRRSQLARACQNLIRFIGKIQRKKTNKSINKGKKTDRQGPASVIRRLFMLLSRVGRLDRVATSLTRRICILDLSESCRHRPFFGHGLKAAKNVGHHEIKKRNEKRKGGEETLSTFCVERGNIQRASQAHSRSRRILRRVQVHRRRGSVSYQGRLMDQSCRPIT